MDLQSRIAALIEPSLNAMGFILVRVRFGGTKRPTLQIMAERPDGTMTVEDCADVSRSVSALLDVEDPIPSNYQLEVSSPGLERPLVRIEDYQRFAGYEVKLETALLIDGRKRWRGRIRGVDGEQIRLDVEGSEQAFEIAAITEARLVVTDDLITASLKGLLPPPPPATLPVALQTPEPAVPAEHTDV